MAIAGYAPSFHDCAKCGAPGPHLAFNVVGGGSVCPLCRPPGSAAPARETLGLLSALLTGDWVIADASIRAIDARVPVWSRPSSSGTSNAACAHPYGGAVTDPRPQSRYMLHRFLTLPEPVLPWSPRRRCSPRGRRHGWQRPVGQRARTAPERRGTRPGEAALLDVVAGAIEAGSDPPVGLRLPPPRTGSARPRRCASSWASTAT